VPVEISVVIVRIFLAVRTFVVRFVEGVDEVVTADMKVVTVDVIGHTYCCSTVIDDYNHYLNCAFVPHLN